MPKPHGRTGTGAHIYFSEHFEVDPRVLKKYGAFNPSVVSDLPLFIDPFLLFNSRKTKYQALHAEIIKYLRFLRDKASQTQDPGLLAAWYRFPEVKQNWFGFTLFGNQGRALGRDFAQALNSSLNSILNAFGEEQVTQGTHLEKLCLIRPGVGRDSISDFTTNLIKGFLCQYTQRFVEEHLDESKCGIFTVSKVQFNYETETWESAQYLLPALGDDFVLLTPMDLLTRGETWISQSDMLHQFSTLQDAIPNDELRAQINNYFKLQLGRRHTARERRQAEQATIARYPELIDYYIKGKEDKGAEAGPISMQKVEDTRRIFNVQLSLLLADLEAKSDFYAKPWTSYDEALDKAKSFKEYVEHQDGYKLVNRVGQPFSREEEVQIYFGLMWCKSEFDVNREVNNGRGPVDFKISFGSGDKSLIEFKLGSSSSLKRNLVKQIEIYEAANQTRKTVKVIICYTGRDQKRVQSILKALNIENEPSIVVIDARKDNKPSASKAS